MKADGPVRQSICLCMIVKNEAAVIARCLNSVKRLIDYWVIVDTGSSDATREVISATLAGLPGELHERPWRDFAHNRSEALVLARGHGDYVLVIDADDALELPEDYVLPALTADCYMVSIEDGGTRYRRNQLFRNALDWRYRGVLHEFPEADGAGPAGLLDVVMRRNHDGARRRDSETYRKDAEIIAAALAVEGDAFMQARYQFYLAQSLRDCGDAAAAAAAYERRAQMGFWAEEVFIALYRAAQLRENLGASADEVLALYERASAAAPHRAEALHGAARLCRNHARNREGYEIAKRGLELAQPADGLFVESWIYDYGLADEYAVNGYWAGAYKACLETSLRLLDNPKLPASERLRVLANARFAAGNLPGERDLGRFGITDFFEQHDVRNGRALQTRLDDEPMVLVAILAKQKQVSLPLYLECIEALEYSKTRIFLYIRTNNNTDRTEIILREWVARVGHLYAGVEFDSADVAAKVERFGVHEWNATRFKVLGRIRNISLRRALERGCDFYFVSDVDNFIRPGTLRALVALNLPVVAPFLRTIDANSFYANYHAEIDENGFYRDCEQYFWILNRWVRGVIEVPVVHTTYLVRADVAPRLSYEDATDRFEYVVFSDSARRAGVAQYIDNREVYGYITFDEGGIVHVADGIERVRTLLAPELNARRTGRPKTLVFCTSFASEPGTWARRYRRWLTAIERSGLAYDQILLVDDGSAVLPDWPDVAVIRGEIETLPLTDKVLYHFENHVGRAALFDFAGWYRSFAFAGAYAKAHGFEKVVHVESDSYVIGLRLVDYINAARTGWTALWCPRHQIPESAIQVMAGDAVARFAEVAKTHPHERLMGRQFETQLPFDVVERSFIGDRYGESPGFVPGHAEYAVQVPDDQPEDYYWWLASRADG